MLDELDGSGFVLCSGAVGESALVRLLEACVPTVEAEQVRHPSGRTYGIRGLLRSSPQLRSELDATGVSAIAAAALRQAAFPIDAIFFDKEPDANWSVPGHQDRLMPIAAGTAVAKTIRDGIGYVEPSAATLGGLLALRIHFDAVGFGDGALEVVPGSHRLGILSTEAIRAIPLSEYRQCVAARGDVLLLRPLLLHRSGRRVGLGHRRVLHVVYATGHPADGPHWTGSA